MAAPAAAGRRGRSPVRASVKANGGKSADASPGGRAATAAAAVAAPAIPHTHPDDVKFHKLAIKVMIEEFGPCDEKDPETWNDIADRLENDHTDFEGVFGIKEEDGYPLIAYCKHTSKKLSDEKKKAPPPPSAAAAPAVSPWIITATVRAEHRERSFCNRIEGNHKPRHEDHGRGDDKDGNHLAACVNCNGDIMCPHGMWDQDGAWILCVTRERERKVTLVHTRALTRSCVCVVVQGSNMLRNWRCSHCG